MDRSASATLTIGETVRQLRELLAKSSWSTRFEAVAARLENVAERPAALEELRSYFTGTIGSLTDLFLCDSNRNLPAGLTMEEANARLNSLRDELFRQLAAVGNSKRRG
jgi:hypothetical protein